MAALAPRIFRSYKSVHQSDKAAPTESEFRSNALHGAPRRLSAGTVGAVWWGGGGLDGKSERTRRRAQPCRHLPGGAVYPTSLNDLPK
jgi:hypothetical protein